MSFSSKNDMVPLAPEANVVFLVNFLSPNLVEVMREISRRVARLDILVSVAMESNRSFQVDSSGLNVIRQRTWTKRKLASHPGGYQEELFVHIPLDTVRQLRTLKPDCVVSLEMGVRSLLASSYRCLFNRNCRHVLSVYGSERSEAGRGKLRLALRRRLLAAADIVTYNGPSCQRYLKALGTDSDKMLPWNYAADPAKAYRGDIQTVDLRKRLQLLTVSQLIERKGMLPAARGLVDWCNRHQEHSVEWLVAGTGLQQADLQRIERPDNLQLTLLGHCEPDQLRTLYAECPVLLFPTLGDEWGLVVDEALASGQLVIGSIYSQAVETLIRSDVNGWPYDPEQPATLHHALDAVLQLSTSELNQARLSARQSVAERTHVQSAMQFVQAVNAALAR